jgi:DNA-binding NarL/FixJ family response regulator
VIALGLAEAEQEVITWAEAGVAGYLGREASLAELVAAIERAARGEATCSARTSAILLRRIAAGPESPVPPWQSERHLTSRECEILQLVGQGLSNQQIARRLFIALSTVKNHMHNILEKLGVHRRTDALREIRRGGFVLGSEFVSEPAERLQPRWHRSDFPLSTG